MAELPLSKQRELNVGAFFPSISKRSKLDITQVEEGLFEMHVKYDRYTEQQKFTLLCS